MEEVKFAKEDKPEKISHKKNDSQLLDLIVRIA